MKLRTKDLQFMYVKDLVPKDLQFMDVKDLVPSEPSAVRSSYDFYMYQIRQERWIKPIEVFFLGDDCIIVNGNNRAKAFKDSVIDKIPVEVVKLVRSRELYLKGVLALYNHLKGFVNYPIDDTSEQRKGRYKYIVNINMNFPDISGVWLSTKERHTYVITQVDDRFVYFFVHNNGVKETSIGHFLPVNTAGGNIYVHVKWNCDGGNPAAPVKSTTGKVILKDAKSVEIRWDDGDVYVKVD